MAFKKAQPEQAAIKMAIYGPPGSGKTATTLLFAEGIAKRDGKRIAFADTERGTDFYAKDVPEREFHPKAWDFDAIYTRSLSEILKDLQSLKFTEHSVIVIDSVTHLWEAAIASYTGSKTKFGGIPMHAWGKIKQPYKQLMHFLINSPFHVFILGRQGNEFIEDAETGETKSAGVKMKAEGETPYEPHICCRMEAVKQLREKSNNKLAAMDAIPTLFVEKDRSGLLQGKIIEWPTFNTVIAPVLKLLDGKQAQMQSTDEAAVIDAEAQAKADAERTKVSKELREQFESRFTFALTKADADAITRDISGDVKKKMLTTDLQALRSIYATTVAAIEKAAAASQPSTNGNGVHHDQQQAKLNAAAAVIEGVTGKPATTGAEIPTRPTNGSQPTTTGSTAPTTEPTTSSPTSPETDEIEAERKAMGQPEGKGDAWEPPEPICSNTRDQIKDALSALSRQWNAKTKKWAEGVIGRPIGSTETLESLREPEGKKLFAELDKLVAKNTATAA